MGLQGRRPGPYSATLALYPAQWREFSPTEAEALGPHSSGPKEEEGKDMGRVLVREEADPWRNF